MFRDFAIVDVVHSCIEDIGHHRMMTPRDLTSTGVGLSDPGISQVLFGVESCLLELRDALWSESHQEDEWGFRICLSGDSTDAFFFFWREFFDGVADGRPGHVSRSFVQPVRECGQRFFSYFSQHSSYCFVHEVVWVVAEALCERQNFVVLTATYEIETSDHDEATVSDGLARDPIFKYC